MTRGTTVLAFLLLAAPALACGPVTDCRLGDGRVYRIRMPDRAAGPVGAILFLHGHGAHASDTMADEELAQAASDLGVALIAPQSAGIGWTMRRTADQPASVAGVEPDYIDRVMANAAARFPIDRSRVMASGTSAGGMMVWYLACYRRDAFAGFAPVSGTFWSAMPRDCGPPPAWLRHVHGRQDPTVPLEGRTLRGGAVQGNVFVAMAIFAAAGGFGPPREALIDGQDCTVQVNPAGAELALCLHDGGHDYRVEDIVSAWRGLAAWDASRVR